MRLFFVFLFISEMAHAGLRVKSCDYDIKTVRHGDVEYAGYYQNPIEVYQSAPNVYRGCTSFREEGLRLSIQAVIQNSRLVIESKLMAGTVVVSRMRGAAVVKSGAFVQSARLPAVSGESTERQIERMKIRCFVGEESLSDRAFDLLPPR